VIIRDLMAFSILFSVFVALAIVLIFNRVSKNYHYDYQSLYSRINDDVFYSTNLTLRGLIFQ